MGVEGKGWMEELVVVGWRKVIGGGGVWDKECGLIEGMRVGLDGV